MSAGRLHRTELVGRHRRCVVALVGVIVLVLQLIGVGRAAAWPDDDYSDGPAGNPDTTGSLHKDYMARIPDDTSLAKIPIMGTHDSWAIHGVGAQTQQLCGNPGVSDRCDVNKQLDAGIRALDARFACIAEGSGGYLEAYHGTESLGSDQHASANDEVVDISTWLIGHPGETVLWDVSHNGTTLEKGCDFNAAFDAVYKLHKDVFWKPTCDANNPCDSSNPDNVVPTMAQARGHIVLIWEHGTDGTESFAKDYAYMHNPANSDTAGGDYDKIQDYGKAQGTTIDSWQVSETGLTGYLSFDEKEAEDNYEVGRAADARTNGKLNWADLAGSSGSLPERVADGYDRGAVEGMNERMLNWLQSQGSSFFPGIILADFPGAALIDWVIHLADVQLDPGGSQAIGVLADDSCPAADSVMLYMDTENDNDKSSTSGAWTGSSFASGDGVSLSFCRVSNPESFGPRSDGTYAVLQLGDVCPNGGAAAMRFFDNENDNNANHHDGDILPSVQKKDTFLRFCVYSRSSTGATGHWPSEPFSYGVFAGLDQVGAQPSNSGLIFTDDENTDNNNQITTTDAALASSFLNAQNDTLMDVVGVAAPTAPVAVSQPADVTVAPRAIASFTAAAYGSPTPTVQWQRSVDGVSFRDVSGATDTTFSFTASYLNNNGNEYRAVFTNASGTWTSRAATLTVDATPPVLVAEPSSTTVNSGATASFYAYASGEPLPSVQWQRSSDGAATFTDIAGATSTTYSFGAHYADTGTYYRALFTNPGGTASSTSALLTVTATAPRVTTQPHDDTVSAGDTASFTAEASGDPSPTPQWQRSTDAGATFTDIPGATNQTYSFTAGATQNGDRYRAAFTNLSGTVLSNVATLSVEVAPTVVTNPSSTAVIAGKTATFTAGASGNPVPTVQWQRSTNGGTTFIDIPGATSAAYTTPATTLADRGTLFRAIFRNAQGAIPTTAATLTVVLPPSITSGNAASFRVGTAGTFTVTTTGTPTPALSLTGQLPQGVTFTDNHDGTATIAGTAAPGTVHAYGLTITADNGVTPDATQSFSLSVAKGRTATDLSSSANPSTYGDSITLTATVTGTDGSGTVSFTVDDSTTPLCAASPLTAVGTEQLAKCSTSSLRAGSHQVSATYSGTASFEDSSAPLATMQVVTKATPVVSWAVPASIVYGTALNDAQLNATADVPGTFAYSPVAGTILPAGVTQLSATFTPSDPLDYTTASGSVFLGITPVGTSTTVTSGPTPSEYGQPVTLTAHVTPAISTADITGLVTFVDGSRTLGSDALSSGAATLTVPSLGVGTHTITATYSGDVNAQPSSADVTQTVQRDRTTLVAASAGNGLLTIGKVTLRATLTRTFDGATLADRTVRFTIGTATVCTGVTDESGVATCVLHVISLLGTYRATFTGDATDTPSSSTARL